jgi:hypothetical protein
MPNGKGGFMTFRDGYSLAAVLFGFSLVWLIVAWRYGRRSLSSGVDEFQRSQGQN